jgi:hypothetical protein
VPAREQRHQQVVDHLLLADDAFADLAQQHPPRRRHLAYGVEVARRIHERHRRGPGVVDDNLAGRALREGGRRHTLRHPDEDATTPRRLPRSIRASSRRA